MKKTLKEAFEYMLTENNEWRFDSSCDDVSVYGYGKEVIGIDEFLVDIDGFSVNVNWDFFISPRNTGIDGMYMTVNQVSVEFDWNIEFDIDDLSSDEIAKIEKHGTRIDKNPKFNYGNTEEYEGTFKKTISNQEKSGWTIEVEENLKFNSGIYPQSVEIDFKTKTITVNFGE